MEKLALTLFAEVIENVQVVVPLQAPLQPAKVELPPGVAVSVTLVPESKSAAQVVPQLIPPALLVTVPLPPPAFAIVSVNLGTAALTVSTTCGATL
ncbi:MAG: hypothetical protein E6G38_09775 [Actinobacteria bacterium]|nr:MAG: hypothetical protein E6G38_09775 [Actinomycetota bacterium]